LALFYADLNQLIVKYDMIQWETTASQSWEQKSTLAGLFNYQEHLYICTLDPDSVSILDRKSGTKLKECTSFGFPWGIDMDEKRNLLYVADKLKITILNLQDLDIISDWRIPTEGYGYFRGLKYDDNILYLTIGGKQQIFLCDPSNGTILNKWGTVTGSSKSGSFDYPFGLTIHNKCLYICDCDNHRVQILYKESGQYVDEFGSGEGIEKGELKEPSSIFYCKIEEIFYVGDLYSVQLFLKDKICIQRIGDVGSGNKMDQFNDICGICVIDDQLYLSDSNNKRIQIFRPIT